MLRTPTATMALIVVLVAPMPSAADVPAPRAEQWRLAVPYVHDASWNVSPMSSLGSEPPDGVPPGYLLALADAQLRTGHLRAATRLFDETIASDPAAATAPLAAIGRGWVAVRRGRFTAAREAFAAAASAPGSTGVTAKFLMAFVDAQSSDGLAAAERFASVAADPDAPEPLQTAAQLGAAYARLWAGDDAGAHAAFDALAEQTAGTPTADDARFAAAVIDWRSGDTARAEETLRTLAEAWHESTRSATSRLVDLDPRALVRASARRYRDAPFGLPSDVILSMFTGDAPARARIALRRLQAGHRAPRTRQVVIPHVGDTATQRRFEPAAPSDTVPPSGGAHAHQTARQRSNAWPGFVATALATTVLAAIAPLWMTRRRHGGTSEIGKCAAVDSRAVIPSREPPA